MSILLVVRSPPPHPPTAPCDATNALGFRSCNELMLLLHHNNNKRRMCRIRINTRGPQRPPGGYLGQKTAATRENATMSIGHRLRNADSTILSMRRPKAGRRKTIGGRREDWPHTQAQIYTTHPRFILIHSVLVLITHGVCSGAPHRRRLPLPLRPRTTGVNSNHISATKQVFRWESHLSPRHRRSSSGGQWQRNRRRPTNHQQPTARRTPSMKEMGMHCTHRRQCSRKVLAAALHRRLH
jgi:hypothetical protein